ncbi:translation elongation factor Ts [Halonatronum saccharophilum]|uniref:translation elongation factor Ts n=1 Tax=Halonatronum saccharophilum TaxID=150060 RepID=UPI00047F774B|nr:translation elongation factor Ts [Halonatronum saccharophilum]
MAISTADIKKLRGMTNAGILDCKKALQETDGDMDKAVEYLREKGIASAEKKAGRTAAQGLVSFKEEGNLAVVVEVNSETDFVAKNDNFKEVVDNIANHILSQRPESVESALEQPLLGEGKKVQEYLKESIAKIGENISLRRFEIFEKEDGDVFGTYLHMGGNIGVLTLLEGGDEESAKNIAMHIAAANPSYLNRDEVPSEDIEKEKEVLKNQALGEGKPEHIVEKIVEGRIDKFYSLNCLIEQEYVRDTDMTVGELLEEKEAQLKAFVRYEVGEGIEVEEEDFAKEVMSEVNK